MIPNIKPVTLEGPKYTEMTLNIDRANVIQEEEGNYKERLENLVNYQDNNEEIEELGEEGLANISEVKEMPLEKLPELYPVALLLGTYIVCENEKGIYLIDQHAAKERVNYEKVSEMLAHPNNLIIKPLVPIVLELPQNEFLIIKENIDILMI